MQTETKYTYICISENTKKYLNELRGVGQSYDDLLQELVILAQKHPRLSPAYLPGGHPEIIITPLSKEKLRWAISGKEVV